MYGEKMGDDEVMGNAILDVCSVKKTYDNTGNKEHVLEEVTFSVEKNDFLCILGPSGCGKTTLLRCIAGFEDFEGKILADGREITGPGIDRVMVFQDFNQLFPWKTVEKNIQYGLKLQGIRDKDTLEAITADALDKVKLTGYGTYYPYQLSGGMKQRVAIAKAVALKPSVILMDEPFAALDAMTRNALQQELLSISQNEDCTIIFITHNIQEAIVLGKRIMVLQNGGKITKKKKNLIPKPVTPSSEGYAEAWNRYHDALYQN